MIKNNISIERISCKDINYIKMLEKSQNVEILSNINIEDDINNKNYIFLKLLLNEYIIGYISVSYCIDTMDIISIVINKNYSKMGFGSTLLEYIINIARKKNIKSIFLEVRKSNIIAQKLYEKFNFKYINTRPNYYTNNHEDAYVYLLEL